MWQSRKYIEGLMAKSLYEPLRARERSRLDRAMARDTTLCEVMQQLESVVAKLPEGDDVNAPDLLPDLRIAIAAEEPVLRRWSMPMALRFSGAALGVCFIAAIWYVRTPLSSPDPLAMTEVPMDTLMRQAIDQAEALVREHDPEEALHMLDTALRAQPADPDAAEARLMLADLSFEEGRYETSLTSYAAMQTAHADRVLVLEEDVQIRIAERLELLDECSADNFEMLMAYDAALREVDGRFDRLESVAARAASDPHGLLAGRVLWSMAEVTSDFDSLSGADNRVAALERVLDRCSNPIVAARASFEAGRTYETEVGDRVRAIDAYRVAGTHSAYEAAAATAIARLEPQ
jgi:hypothetical protein